MTVWEKLMSKSHLTVLDQHTYHILWGMAMSMVLLPLLGANPLLCHWITTGFIFIAEGITVLTTEKDRYLMLKDSLWDFQQWQFHWIFVFSWPLWLPTFLIWLAAYILLWIWSEE
jgi:hypothetical protein